MSNPRTTFSLPPQERKDLDFLGELTESSQNETMRNAIRFYASAARLAMADIPLYCKDGYGREIPLLIPGLPSEIYTQQVIALVAPIESSDPK